MLFNICEYAQRYFGALNFKTVITCLIVLTEQKI